MTRLHAKCLAATLLLAVSPVARASFLVCEETVNVQPAVALDQFPASLTYDLTVTDAMCAWCDAQDPSHWCHSLCPGGGASVVMTEEDAALAALLALQGKPPIDWATTNPFWVPPLPFWLHNGESVTTSVAVTIASYAECATWGRALTPPALPDPAGNVVIQDRYRVTWNLDGAPPYYAECSARVTCLPPLGPTRTLGFFKTHPAATAACVASGPIDLGFISIPQGDAATALGLLYASPARYANDVKRSPLDQARLLLARQLLVAVCNGRVFGSTPADTSFVPAAVNALAGTACSTMNWLQGQLDAFNNSGDTGENYFGSAAPGSYPDPTFPSGLGCN